ncbi:MAG: 2-amino-4-hydroxy-6-hydroxymethyldihydropteridine diphosphokinase [Stellaceae bacterium]
MILVGIGSNLAAPGFASPQQTALAAVAQLPAVGARVVCCSRWYLSEPVPRSDQPWYINAVARVETRLTPEALLAALLALEARFERRRGEPNAARTLDLDLLDYEGRQSASERLVLPHPRLHERRFVLAPLAEIAPQWRHPLLAMSACELLRRLPPGQPIRAIDE